MTLRDKYLGTASGKKRTIDIEGWGTVQLHNFTLAQIKHFEELEKGDGIGAALKLFTVAVVDEFGKAVFTEDDVEMIRSTVAWETILAVTRAAIGVTPEMVEDAKKNSEPTPASALN